MALRKNDILINKDEDEITELLEFSLSNEGHNASIANKCEGDLVLQLVNISYLFRGDLC